MDLDKRNVTSKNRKKRYKVRLARIVEDVCHFGYTSTLYDGKAYLVVRLIFKAIEKGLKQDGKVSIGDFGTFQVKYGWRLRPVVRFIPRTEFRRSLDDEQA